MQNIFLFLSLERVSKQFIGSNSFDLANAHAQGSALALVDFSVFDTD